MTAAEELAEKLGAPRGEVDARRLVPMLCERDPSRARVLSQSGFLFELKLDGVRIVADKSGTKVRLAYRKLRDATESYSEIADAVSQLGDARVVLDGEIVAFDERGHPSFEKLAHRIHGRPRSRSAETVPVVYVVFDVLAVGDFDLRKLPLEARKAILETIVPESGVGGGLVRLHPTFTEGEALFRLCRENALEGVVAKRLGSTYRSGDRTFDWIKIKTELDADLVVSGWTEGEGKRSHLGSLDLAAYEDGRFVVRGRVGSGLDGDTIDVLLDRLMPLEVAKATAEESPALALARRREGTRKKRHFVRPELVVSVRYGGITRDGVLRFPVFRGLRPDLNPEDCSLALEGEAAAKPAAGDEIEVYLERVAPALLAEVRGRVCSFLRKDPRGSREAGKGSRIWPPPRTLPKTIRTATVIAGGSATRGYVLESSDALAAAARAGCIEIAHDALREGKPGRADFVAVRIEASHDALAKGAADAVARASLVVADLALRVGLPACVKSAGRNVVDVVIGVGEQPIEAAYALGELLVRLASEDPRSRGARLVRVDAIAAAWSPLAADPTLASVPFAREEIAEAVAGIDLETAAERARSGASPSVAALLAEPVDVARAVIELERAVAESPSALRSRK